VLDAVSIGPGLNNTGKTVPCKNMSLHIAALLLRSIPHYAIKSNKHIVLKMFIDFICRTAQSHFLMVVRYRSKPCSTPDPRRPNSAANGSKMAT
jgi:hypothetical protein